MKSRRSSARSLLQRFLELAVPTQPSPCSTARSNLARLLLWGSCSTCCGAAVVENFVTGRQRVSWRTSLMGWQDHSFLTPRPWWAVKGNSRTGPPVFQRFRRCLEKDCSEFWSLLPHEFQWHVELILVVCIPAVSVVLFSRDVSRGHKFPACRTRLSHDG